MSKEISIFKIIAGTLQWVSLWLFIVLIPIPKPPSGMNSVMAFIAITLFLTGLGLFISVRLESE